MARLKEWNSMESKTNLSNIRKKTLSKRGIAELAKHSRKPLTHDELPAPYTKTPKMMYLELKHHKSIEELINLGTIYECAKKLKVHPTTVYYWRMRIEEGKNEEFFNQFK